MAGLLPLNCCFKYWVPVQLSDWFRIDTHLHVTTSSSRTYQKALKILLLHLIIWKTRGQRHETHVQEKKKKKKLMSTSLLLQYYFKIRIYYDTTTRIAWSSRRRQRHFYTSFTINRSAKKYHRRMSLYTLNATVFQRRKLVFPSSFSSSSSLN